MQNQLGIQTDRRANLQGSCWMIFAMAAFAVEDSFIKLATVHLPISQVLVLFGLGGMGIFAGALLVRKEKFITPDILSKPMFLRMGFEITGRLFFTLAIALSSLSSATVILQATPILVVLGATLLFGEKVGWRRWIAILLAMIGVLIIIRPTGADFSFLSLLAVIAMLGFVGRDLASRAAPISLSIYHLGFYGFLALVIAGGMIAVWEEKTFIWSDVDSLFYAACAVLLGVFAYSALMKAMRTGTVSSVTPFRYSRLLFGIALGVFLFQEKLDTAMLIGSAFIVASGLFILMRSELRA